MTSNPHWETIGPPPLSLFAREQARAARGLAGFRARREPLRKVQRGDGHAVFVLPGLLAGDLTTRPLRSFLRTLCYDACGWKLGVNTGPTPADPVTGARPLRAKRHTATAGSAPRCVFNIRLH
jgi:hypothetical protein